MHPGGAAFQRFCDHGQSCDNDQCLGVLLPHLVGVVVQRVERVSGIVWISAHVRAAQADCGSCGRPSARVHSRYGRSLADAALGGRRVVILLRVRRFFCDQESCQVKTFVEQVAGLSVPHARRTAVLAGMLESIGVALAGRAGSRLAVRLGLPVGRQALLRLVRALPDPEITVVSVLGVDDFALRRGHRYGTVLIDMNTHRPVDVLDDRLAETFAAWLLAHPGVTVVCRDRGGAYAEGARTGAPQAIQVADRWHLWHNLAEHVEKTVAAHHSCLHRDETVPTKDPAEASSSTELADAAHAERRENSALVTRTKARYQEVQALKAQGRAIKAIKRELGLAKETVRRFYRATSLEELLAKPRAGRPSILDEFKAHLHDRWNQGHTNVLDLHREITGLGYRGSYSSLRDYLAPFRALGAAPRVPAVPKVRQITSWLLRRPEDLDAEEQVKLKQVLAACPHLSSTAVHVTAFAQMLTGRRGELLDAWMSTIDAEDLPHLHRFVRGLRLDHAAVLNGLTLPYSSGAVEGNVNRIKMIKRQMYGRAKFDLLRKRILHAA
jgi:transposase